MNMKVTKRYRILDEETPFQIFISPLPTRDAYVGSVLSFVKKRHSNKTEPTRLDFRLTNFFNVTSDDVLKDCLNWVNCKFGKNYTPKHTKIL